MLQEQELKQKEFTNSITGNSLNEEASVSEVTESCKVYGKNVYQLSEYGMNQFTVYLPITTRYIPAQKSTVGDSLDVYFSSMFVQRNRHNPTTIDRLWSLKLKSKELF